MIDSQRVALVLFPIWGAGGLATDVGHYRRILRDAGHHCDFWQIRYSNKDHGVKGPIRFSTGADGPTVEQGYLSITDYHVRDTVKTLNRYDVIVFLHPAPHVADKQKAVKNWKYLYTKTKPRKITRFTDVYLDKLYPHILDVANTFEAWATNMAQLRYVQQFIPEAQLATYPMHFKNRGLRQDKRFDILWPSAWRGWKGIKQFLNAAPDIDGTIKMIGSGRELRAQRKAENPYALECPGAVPPPQAVRLIRQARMSVDLTGFSKKYYGHSNRTVYEPMFFGTVVSVQEFMPAPYGDGPSRCFALIDKSDIAQSFNTYLGDPNILKEIAGQAYEWATKRFSHERVVKEIMEGI